MSKAIVFIDNGNLGKDPELRRTTNGSAVCNFSVATTESFKSKGEEKEVTDWHAVTCWGSLAEYAAEHLKKGSPVTVIGKLKTRSYEKDGVKKYVTEVIADVVLPGKKVEKQSGPQTVPESELPF
jgi:single-strand DNA-binding protein